MENDEKALEALKKIEEVIDEVRDLFPTIKKEIKISTKKYFPHFTILHGIIYLEF